MTFVPLTDFSRFKRVTGVHPHDTIFLSPILDTAIEWNELILSWNLSQADGQAFQFEARPVFADQDSRFYHLGHWTANPGEHRRESVNDQKDAIAQVQTDTLLLRKPARRVQLRVTVRSPRPLRSLPARLLALSLFDSRSFQALGTNSLHAPAKRLPVPERSQVSYDDGREWCSPTSVSMVLAYWAQVLKRPELNIDVPLVAAGVHDPKWPGTGNWPFNTAFAGSFPGLRAYVTRLADLSELEALIHAGVPPIVSVSFDLLNGKEKDQGTGHLIVCVGTTSSGDFIINDPWAVLDKGERVQRVATRKNLNRGWMRSKGVVYLIHPDDWKMPAGSGRHWMHSPAH